jgi:hypothetical protein
MAVTDSPASRRGPRSGNAVGRVEAAGDADGHAVGEAAAQDAVDGRAGGEAQGGRDGRVGGHDLGPDGFASGRDARRAQVLAEPGAAPDAVEDRRLGAHEGAAPLFHAEPPLGRQRGERAPDGMAAHAAGALDVLLGWELVAVDETPRGDVAHDPVARPFPVAGLAHVASGSHSNDFAMIVGHDRRMTHG